MFHMIRSLAVYEGVIREAILKMKFHQDFGISEYLGNRLSAYLKELEWQFDLIIPVPLNPVRQKSRGYNQSYRLALPISLCFNIPIKETALQRTLNTTSQAELAKEQRLTNLRGAFLANKDLVQGKRILLVDDIATTSSTINACSQALYNQQARDVVAITVARAV
jgi:competence protein ComFC